MRTVLNEFSVRQTYSELVFRGTGSSAVWGGWHGGAARGTQVAAHLVFGIDKQLSVFAARRIHYFSLVWACVEGLVDAVPWAWVGAGEGVIVSVNHHRWDALASSASDL